MGQKDIIANKLDRGVTVPSLRTSAYSTAVTTLDSQIAQLEVLKAYLYVQTPVEQALRAEIE